jgi:hypothetical protein
MSGLLEHSSVLVYGRVVEGISIDAGNVKDDGLGSNRFLHGQLTAKDGGKNKQQLATIYGFEFEGHYYDLPKPTILLVHGDPKSPKAAGAAVEPDPELADNVKVWRYDKADFSMRFDVESGPLEAILLEEALDSSAMAAQTSGKRVSGKRVSGKRMSGD